MSCLLHDHQCALTIAKYHPKVQILFENSFSHKSKSSGGSKGAPGTRVPRVQILSFLCSVWQKYCKIIGWRSHLGSLPPLGNPESTTKACRIPVFHTNTLSCTLSEGISVALRMTSLNVVLLISFISSSVKILKANDSGCLRYK